MFTRQSGIEVDGADVEPPAAIVRAGELTQESASTCRAISAASGPVSTSESPRSRRSGSIGSIRWRRCRASSSSCRTRAAWRRTAVRESERAISAPVDAPVTILKTGRLPVVDQPFRNPRESAVGAASGQSQVRGSRTIPSAPRGKSSGDSWSKDWAKSRSIAGLTWPAQGAEPPACPGFSLPPSAPGAPGYGAACRTRQ